MLRADDRPQREPPDDAAVGRSRQLALRVNLVKLLGLACLAPPATVGIAQRADLLLPADEVATAVATISSLGILFAVAGALLLGRATDRNAHSPRRHWLLVAVASTIGIAGLAMMAGAHSVLLLGAGWVLGQLGFSGAMAVLRTLLAFALPVQRSRGAVMMILFSYVGAFVPIVIIMLLPGSVWVTSLALAVLATSAPALFARRAPGHQERIANATSSSSYPARTPGTPAAHDTNRAVLRWPVLLFVHFAANIFFAAYVAYHALEIAGRQTGSLGEDAVRTSMIMLAAALVGLILTAALLLARPRLLARPAWLVAGAGILLAASTLVRFAVDHPALLIAALACSGVSIGLNSCAVFTSALESARVERVGRWMGVYSAVGLLGQLIGPPLGLLVISLSAGGDGYRNIFACLAAIPAVWAIAALAGAGRPRRLDDTTADGAMNHSRPGG